MARLKAIKERRKDSGIIAKKDFQLAGIWAGSGNRPGIHAVGKVDVWGARQSACWHRGRYVPPLEDWTAKWTDYTNEQRCAECLDALFMQPASESEAK